MWVVAADSCLRYAPLPIIDGYGFDGLYHNEFVCGEKVKKPYNSMTLNCDRNLSGGLPSGTPLGFPGTTAITGYLKTIHMLIVPDAFDICQRSCLN
jgi:hypothetical protein